jgi:hypothetical protein
MLLRVGLQRGATQGTALIGEFPRRTDVQWTRGSSMPTLTPMVPRALGAFLTAVCLLVAARSLAFAAWPNDLPQPSHYVIEGYLDHSPTDANICDRIEIVAHGKRHTLMVTRYGTPGATGLDRYLSRIMAKPFDIWGTSEDVDRLMDAPPGTKIAGTFAAYTQGAPWLLIADLTEPEPKS